MRKMWPDSTQIIRESLCCGTSPGSIVLQICKSAVLFGEKLSPETLKISIFNWLRAKLWFSENVVTIDMKYSIEANVISYYSKCKSVDVESSGV